MSNGYYPPLDQVNAIVKLGHYLQLNVPEYTDQTLRELAASSSFGPTIHNSTAALGYFHSAFGSNATISHGQAVIASLVQEDTCKGASSVNAFMDVLSFLFVALRLLSKRISGSRLKWDDHLVWIAWVFFLAKQPFILYECKHLHIGNHAWDLPIRDFKLNLQIAFWLEIPYYPNLCLVKLSILCFYGTIFRAYRRALLACYILGVVLILGNVMAVIGVFQYQPIEYWNHLLDYQPRYDRLAFFSAIGYITIITDFIMLGLPVCILPKIKAMHVRDKIVLLCLFACGTFAGVAGILRLISLPTWVRSADWTAASTRTALFSLLEIHMALICACVPHLKPIAVRTKNGFLWLIGKAKVAGSGSRKDSDISGVIVALDNNKIFNQNGAKRASRAVIAKCGFEFDEKDMDDIIDPSKQHYNVAVAALPTSPAKTKKKGMFSAIMGSLDMNEGTVTDFDIKSGDLSKSDTKDSLRLSSVATSATQSVSGPSRSPSIDDRHEENSDDESKGNVDHIDIEKRV